jgi:L-amino acid N-acyltransferase YncA
MNSQSDRPDGRPDARPNVRDASERDAAACAAIYAPYVSDTAITFEIDPPTSAEMAERIAAATRTHAWVVLEDQGSVVGYAYGSPFHPRAAYRWACEASVFLELGRRRTGGGRALYDALLPRLIERGFRVVVAGMTLPNDASVGLHRAMGFEPVGTYRRIGFKHGSWHDVAWMQHILGGGGGGGDPPPEPT